MPVFGIKQGDTGPPFRARFRAAGRPVDLTGATVRFRMGKRGSCGPPVLDAPAVVTDAALGLVEYHWTPTDTAERGVYHAELKATLADGRVISSPGIGFYRVAVVRDLDYAA